MRLSFSLGSLGLLCAAAFAIGPAAAQNLSTSVLRPSAVDPATGVIAGKLPGGGGTVSYYLAVELRPGDLLTNLRVTGRPNVAKRLELELLDGAARVSGQTYVLTEREGQAETTKAFAIDSPGRYVVRLNVEGPETGTFCVQLGGASLPNANSPGCPAQAAAAPPRPPVSAPVRPLVATPATAPVSAPAPAPAKSVEVIVTRCEERLRVGADFLFDFDRADVRPEATDAITELAHRIMVAKKPVMVEGHTDAIGTETYNQGLSERRAKAVRVSLAARDVPTEWLRVRGLGKSKPVAPNQHADGSDDPEGRQKNRRVEVVINTCP
jgi:outer membrane protein OmpA-like peptidoglycan-associated protein